MTPRNNIIIVVSYITILLLWRCIAREKTDWPTDRRRRGHWLMWMVGAFFLGRHSSLRVLDGNQSEIRQHPFSGGYLCDIIYCHLRLHGENRSGRVEGINSVLYLICVLSNNNFFKYRNFQKASLSPEPHMKISQIFKSNKCTERVI